MSEVAVGGIATVVVGMLTVMGVTQGHLWSRLKQAEDKQTELRNHSLDQDRRIEELWDKRRDDAVVIRGLGDHIDALEHHIWSEKPPPPPPRPEGL